MPRKSDAKKRITSFSSFLSYYLGKKQYCLQEFSKTTSNVNQNLFSDAGKGLYEWPKTLCDYSQSITIRSPVRMIKFTKYSYRMGLPELENILSSRDNILHYNLISSPFFFTEEEDTLPPTESEDEEEERYARTEGTVRQKRKKGNWKNIGSTPKNYVTYPCECRWKIRFPKEPCVKYRQVRWVVLPLSDRIAQLALPLLRRLLALWLEFGDKFPPEMRARLMAFLIENYGLSEEFLEQILEEARKAREEAGKKKEKKGKKRKKAKKKRQKKGKKEKEKKEKKGKKEKPAKEGSKKEKKVKEKESGLGFKRRKPGKLPLDWPYKMGSKFILMCISYLSRDPDENFNSRATEYFDVQSMGILDEVCRFMNMPLPDPERPTQYGETLVIMALNLSNWIAKYVISPAEEIPDDMVDEYLALRGVIPKPKKEKKGKDKKGGSEKSGKKEKGKGVVQEPPIEEPQEPQRGWNEMKSPVYVPMKTRISKKKISSMDEEGYVTETDLKEEDDIEESEPRWRRQMLDDVKQDFLEYLNWYNPWSPEFMYLGPKTTPPGIEMFKIRDTDNENVPDDLRALNWKIVENGYSEGYSFIPSPVPQYYPCLRPLRPIRLEDLERSGIPEEVIKQSLRFFSPWYIMSHPLRAVQIQQETEQGPYEESQAKEDEGDEQKEPESEESIEDEILIPSAPPKINDSVWGDYKMKEQLEILFHILHLTASTPELTIEYVFELLEEFCFAVECAEAEENSSEENQKHRKKRTIILERYYLNFFGKKFRDYNDRTPHYMRTICSRLAYYIQLLFEFTARNLWELQSRPNLPSPMESPPETPDDEQALQDWDEWLAWLLKVTKTCDEWAGWISDTVEMAERKAEKKKGEFIGPDGRIKKLTEEEWFDWKEEVEEKIQLYRSSKKIYSKESPYYLDKAKDILPVRHRPVKKFAQEEQEDEEGGAWEDMSDAELENGEEDLPGPDDEDEQVATEKVTDKDTTADETEYEDLTEND